MKNNKHYDILFVKKGMAMKAFLKNINPETQNIKNLEKQIKKGTVKVIKTEEHEPTNGI